MKLVLILSILCVVGCRGPKTAQEIQSDSNAQMAKSASMIRRQPQGRPHVPDVLGFCELCGKDLEVAATCEACPVASEGWIETGGR